MLKQMPMTPFAHECWPVAGKPLTLPPPLSQWERPSLFLDFDGTLVAIADHPQAVEVSATLPGLLTRLNDFLDGRLAIISGRAIADLDRFLDLPSVSVAGSHGGELRMGNSRSIQAMASPMPSSIASSLNELAAQRSNLLVESKPFSVAIHYRAQPELGPEVLEYATSLAETAGLTLKPGKMVVELVMPGVDKGRAVGTFMQMPTFKGSRPIFVGDDMTDEDAFRSVLDLEGGGVLVGRERETAAIWRLPAVSDVYHWLEAAL